MEARTVIRGWRSLAVVAVLMLPAAAFAQGARLQLDGLSRLSAQAIDATDIAIDPAMLGIVGNFLQDNDKDAAAVKQLMSELKGVYVKSFKFDRDGVYTPADVQGIRNQLSRGWTRLVSTESRKPEGQEIVEIYSLVEGNRSSGLVILVAEPRELTVVNIIGPIDLNRLAALKGQFGIPDVPTK
jgi:hypothetical protein